MALDVEHKTVQSNRFTRLGTLYLLALVVIASVAIIGQILIQSHLRGQLSDSRVVNVAGKQRMLSQKIAKTVLLLRQEQPAVIRDSILEKLETSVYLWKTSQEGLQHGNDSLNLPGSNSAKVTTLFKDVDEHYQQMREGTFRIIKLLKEDRTIATDSLQPYIAVIIQHEDLFLAGMERIVLQYEEEATDKVASLATIEYFMLIVVLVVIALELIFIFRPTTLYVNKTIIKLMASERNARKLTREIGELYASLERSYEQLSIVNQPIESPRLLARTDRGGNVTYLADVFTSLSGISMTHEPMRLSDLFENIGNADDWMDEIVDTISEGRIWQEELICHSAAGEKTHWVDVTITPVYNDQKEVEELLILGSDITKRKDAELTMKQKNRAEIEKKINQQKFRSVLILEGQEEERKRLAMDIHDGIGQMLTSLNFQINSIDLHEKDKAAQKISEIDHLVKDVIKEVRRITFNLKPTVLGDYGLQAALRVFITEISKLTTVELMYKSEGEVERLPQNVENNIFRIIQEAINNAIKYAGASLVEIELRQAGNDLLISVKDAGKGFDAKMVDAKTINIESGRGFFNMYERTEYINGKLEIISAPGKGTTVQLTVPLRTKVTA